MFNPEKAANVVAYLILKSGKNSMRHLKLMKLFYLAEREYLTRFDSLMVDDDFVSMKNGPVLSKTYDLMKSTPCIEWDKRLSRINNYEITLKKETSFAQLLHISKADKKVLDSVFSEFGHFSADELVTYVHEKCHEWRETNSSVSIDIIDVLRALNKSENIAESINLSKRL